MAAPGAPGAPAPAGRTSGVEDITRRARGLADSGQYDQALAEIVRGLAVAPADLGLLGLKASVLLEKRAYLDALAAYRAWVAAGLKGAKLREAQEIIAMLEAARTTSLEVVVANGPAEVYVDSKARGVVCRAEPSCSTPELPGKYKVIVERPGCLPWTTSVIVAAGATARLAVTLIESPSLLTVRVTPSGAHITVDDTDYAAPVTVAPGPHHVVVALAGHVDERRDTEAHLGAPIDLDISLTPRVPVHIEPPGATLTLDDKPVALQDGTLAIPPGDHVLIAHAAGYQDGRLRIAAVHGELALALRPKPAPRLGLTTRRKLAIAAGGVGVAALAGGIVLGLAAKDADHNAFQLCPSPTTPCASAAAADDLNRRGRTRALEANLAFGAAGAVAITAAILWFTGLPESPVAVTPRLGAVIGDVAGLDLAVKF